MCSLDTLKIDLKGLKDDTKEFTFNLGNDYFAALDEVEVTEGDVSLLLTIHRTGERYFDLSFHIEGEVTVLCDRCLDDMRQPVSSDNRLVVQFGTEYSEDDDLVTIDEDEGIIDISWFVYEFIALSIPIQHVHAPGKCNRAMIEMLEEHSATRSSDGDGEKPIDPRWSGLEKLKQIIKD